jgi:hypothetical protein
MRTLIKVVLWIFLVGSAWGVIAMVADRRADPRFTPIVVIGLAWIVGCTWGLRKLRTRLRDEAGRRSSIVRLVELQYRFNFSFPVVKCYQICLAFHGSGPSRLQNM